jgi:tetratricopeptide (TPR) repeat protein
MWTDCWISPSWLRDRRDDIVRTRVSATARKWSAWALRACTLSMILLGITPGCHQTPRTPSSQSLSKVPDEKIGARQDSNVQVAFGRTAEQSGDLDEAAAAYTAALKHDGRRADIFQRLAVVHDRMGKFQESAAFYAKAIAADPGNPEIFCDKGYSLYLQRQHKEAEVCLRQALKLQPDLARAHVNLGLVLAREGQVDSALAEFRKGGCSPAVAHQNVAFVLTTEHRMSDARRQYDLALAADPSSSSTKQRLTQLTTLASKQPAPTTPISDPQLLKASTTEATKPTPPARSRWSSRRARRAG